MLAPLGRMARVKETDTLAMPPPTHTHAGLAAVHRAGVCGRGCAAVSVRPERHLASAGGSKHGEPRHHCAYRGSTSNSTSQANGITTYTRARHACCLVLLLALYRLRSRRFCPWATASHGPSHTYTPSESCTVVRRAPRQQCARPCVAAAETATLRLAYRIAFLTPPTRNATPLQT